MQETTYSSLRPYAIKYIWWKTPDEALHYPQKIMAQVMDIGDYADVLVLIQLVGEKILQDVLQKAEAGQFSPRSWAYWHYRLGLAHSEGDLPLLPQRRFE